MNEEKKILGELSDNLQDKLSDIFIILSEKDPNKLNEILELFDFKKKINTNITFIYKLKSYILENQKLLSENGNMKLFKQTLKDLNQLIELKKTDSKYSFHTVKDYLKNYIENDFKKNQGRMTGSIITKTVAIIILIIIITRLIKKILRGK